MDSAIDTQTGHCEKHGAYTAKVISFGNRKVMPSKCPKCATEALEQKKIQDQKTAEIIEKDTMQRMKEAFERQVPLRFKGANFESFVAENAQQQRAKEICERYCDEFGGKIQDTGGGLIFCGKPGTGKTHLAISIGRELSALGQRVEYANLAGIVRKVRSSWGKEDSHENYVISHYQRYDLLIIDEIGVQAGSDNERNIIFEIVNGRYENVLPTIIISNRDLQEVSALISERSVDRITEGGAVIPFGWKSYRGGSAA